MFISKPFIKNTLFTYISQFLAVLLGILIVKIMALYLTSENLGIYLLSRRLVLLFIPLITLNLAMGLSWFGSKRDFSRLYFNKIFFTYIFIGIGLFIFILIFDNASISQTIYNNNEYEYIINPIFFFAFASGLQVLTVGYLRGSRQYNLMNLSNILYRTSSIVVLLLIIYLKIGTELLTEYFYYGAWLIIIYNIIVLYKDPNKKTNKIVKKQNLKQIFEYSLFRIPSGIFYGLLFFLPIYLTSKWFSLIDATHIGIIITVANTAAMIGVPFNLLFLPSFSHLHDIGTNDQVLERINIIIKFIFQVVFFIGPLIYLFSQEIIIMWFGQNYVSTIIYLQLMSPFVGPFIGYIMIRGIIDGLSFYPYSNIITLFSLISLIVLTFILKIFINNPISIALSFSIGLFILFGISLYTIKRIINISIFTKSNLTSLIFLVIIFILTFFTLSINTSFVYKLMIKFIVSLIMMSSLFYYYYQTKASWIMYSDIIKE